MCICMYVSADLKWFEAFCGQLTESILVMLIENYECDNVITQLKGFLLSLLILFPNSWLT